MINKKCISCCVIKKISEYKSNFSAICRECTSIQKNMKDQRNCNHCYKKRQLENGLCEKCDLIYKILSIKEANNKNYNLSHKITSEDLQSNSIKNLTIILEDFENEQYDYLDMQLEEEYLTYGDHASEEDLINTLDVLNKYQDYDRNSSHQKTVKFEDNSWKKHIPKLLKEEIKDWASLNKFDLYQQAKELVTTSRGKKLEEIRNFVSDFSNVIYSVEHQEEEKEYIDLTDEVSDSIMSVIELIILPHQEVLERSKKHGGRIIFGDLWNTPFKESLKKEVKDRDDWKCVICEGDTDLHVHHKIPRDLGGLHHKDNLVTLCASCHGAVETADLNKAFTKCLANYKRNKSKQNNNLNITKNKTLLKKEVEDQLDSILVILNNKDEHVLVQDVMEIMDKLNVIFYE
jgi:hypothetical protein